MKRFAMVLIGAEVVFAAAIGAAGMHGMTGTAYADSTVPSLPVCVEEDCSDQPGQIGAWQSPNDGRWYVSVGETSYRLDMTISVDVDVVDGQHAGKAVAR